jgi:Flp pilus assembly protein CpaB
MQTSRGRITVMVLVGLALVALAGIGLVLRSGEAPAEPASGQVQVPVVVALRPVPAGQVLSAEDVGAQGWDSGAVPSGAVTRLQDAMGHVVRRDLAARDVLLVTDLLTRLSDGHTEAGVLDDVLGADWVAVAIQAPDLWSQWGIIQPGDRLDVVAIIDLALQGESSPLAVDDLSSPFLTTTLRSPDFPPTQSLETNAEAVSAPEQVVVWTVQNLEVLGVEKEPVAEAAEQGAESALPVVPSRRLLLVLRAVPQDAAVLHYLQDSGAVLHLALRSRQNGRQFDVDAITLDYLLRRYTPGLERMRP